MSIETRTWDYRVIALIRTVDGDTYDITLAKTMDFGFRLTEEKRWSTRFRLLGVDTPELNQEGGAAATKYADGWIRLAIFDDVLHGQTYKTDNFGRWLIDLYRTDNNQHLSAALLESGNAVPYPK